MERDLVPIGNNEIAKGGKQVMDHLFEMIKTKDMGYDAMAQRLNEIYKLEITSGDVAEFFKGNLAIIDKLSKENTPLNLIRANLHLDHNEHLVKDIKILDNEIENVLDDDGMLESNVRAKAIADLVDKKGRLLLRQARLAGKLSNAKRSTNIEKMQVNIFQKVEEKNSELLKDLKKANFKEEGIIDVTPKKNGKK